MDLNAADLQAMVAGNEAEQLESEALLPELPELEPPEPLDEPPVDVDFAFFALDEKSALYVPLPIFPSEWSLLRVWNALTASSVFSPK